jgi:penicillin V acylase-like amidase (Ntn superfamily)
MCSGIKILCADGTVLLSRTLEFGHKFKYSKYISKDVIGLLGDDGLVLDGLNRHGLCCMVFYFKGYIEYSDTEIEGNINLSPLNVVQHLIFQCKNISEVRELAPKITVLNTIYPPWGIVPPGHWICADRSGECCVLEAVDGVLKVYDNFLNIFANSPSFPEQIARLEQYPAFTNKQLEGNSMLGSGFLGLPGDFTSPSRFARLHAFEKTYTKPAKSEDGIQTAFHILNNFDIVTGFVMSPDGQASNTQYTVVYDLSNFDAFIKTYEDQTIKNIRDRDEFPTINKKGSRTSMDSSSSNCMGTGAIISLILALGLIILCVVFIVNRKQQQA